MSNFSLPLPCFGHDTDRKRPFSSVEEKGRFVAITHDNGEKGEQPFLKEDNQPSAQDRFSLKIENLQPKDATVTHIHHYLAASGG